MINLKRERTIQEFINCITEKKSLNEQTIHQIKIMLKDFSTKSIEDTQRLFNKYGIDAVTKALTAYSQKHSANT